MKPIHKENVVLSTIILIMVVFSLLLLPAALVGVYPVKKDISFDLPGVPYVDRPISVYRHETGEVVTVMLEEYVKGVVSGEMPSSFEEEALKAQAVAARTYAMSKVKRYGDGGGPAEHKGAPLCDSTHCQVYRTETELLALKGESWVASEEGWLKITSAVEATEGQLMYFEGELVEQPLFHSASGGKTENSEDVFVSAVPYLRSVDSPYETEAPYQQEQVQLTLNELRSKIEKAYSGKSTGTLTKDTVVITSRSEGGRVDFLQVGAYSVEGRKIRDILGLRSANFTVSFVGDSVVFTTAGYGHGVGMSQWGANGMAQAGYGYKDILKHYYSGVDVR